MLISVDYVFPASASAYADALAGKTEDQVMESLDWYDTQKMILSSLKIRLWRHLSYYVRVDCNNFTDWCSTTCPTLYVLACTEHFVHTFQFQ